VRRVSDSKRSPVVAFSHEIEDWVRKKEVREDRVGPVDVDVQAFQSTWRAPEEVLRESRQLRAEQRQLCAEQRQLRAEQRKLRAEQRQLFDAAFKEIVSTRTWSLDDFGRGLPSYSKCAGLRGTAV